MTRPINIANKLLRVAVALLLVLQGGSLVAFADEFKAGSVMVRDAWARVTIPDRPAAGYMQIHNMGAEADRLVSASSPMADRVELHTHTMENNVMKMRRIDGVDVPGGGHAELLPGGHHLMIFGLKHHAKEGETIPVTVVFENAGSLELELDVRKSAPKKTHDGDTDHSGHGTHSD